MAIACQEVTPPDPTQKSVSPVQPASPQPATPASPPPPPTQPSLQFSSTGTMITPRSGHTATLLLDGRVLIAGGDGPGRSAELYDPVSGTFAPTGPMNELRAMHTATLLPNGQVLIVGPVSSLGAELYDPATGNFVRTGSMLTPQSIVSATLLPSGRVFVAGELDAELFDPASGTFRRAGPYTTEVHAYQNLYWYEATLLSDGRVLLSGVPDCAQVYDPARDTFSASGCVGLDGLELHTSTLLNNGKVLIAGGMNDELGSSNIVEVYDPTTGAFSKTGNLQSGRDAHAAVLLSDGKVLIIGGDGTSGFSLSGSLASAELYDPATGAFAAAGNMNTRRTLPRATLLKNGDVLITGGCMLGATPTAELYRPVSASAIAKLGGVR